MNSSQIMAALAKRHRPPAWALLEQVGNGTGFAGNRYADAVALSLWPSRGIELHGFEIKVYRSDWLRELKKPEKAEDIADACDFWWIAAAKGVVDLERDPIPMAWGVLILDGRGLVQHKKAERRTDRAELDRFIVAAILRRATERMIPTGSIAAKLEEAMAEGHERGERHARQADAHEAELRNFAELKDAVAAFEAKSGVTIRRYDGGNIGRTFKVAKELGELKAGWKLTQIENGLVTALDCVRKARETASEQETT